MTQQKKDQGRVMAMNAKLSTQEKKDVIDAFDEIHIEHNKIIAKLDALRANVTKALDEIEQVVKEIGETASYYAYDFETLGYPYEDLPKDQLGRKEKH